MRWDIGWMPRWPDSIWLPVHVIVDMPLSLVPLLIELSPHVMLQDFYKAASVRNPVVDLAGDV